MLVNRLIIVIFVAKTVTTRMVVLSELVIRSGGRVRENQPNQRQPVLKMKQVPYQD
ncbi:hypothetical protein HanXRQr2_Chr13g0612941 [Helianthus annuus]|uniref:Uncharacterized protein n=1 Tax=Helianthus annuus TaxID=4232 RepID=A0A251SXJ4_HELAN|nr:hypothetical protein HanXRQr2_Chr13g0612941 [Helianthus annuus]KAJ0483466.1 hypothetical protein HanIR_Chr13g0665101 [Helianthus annuus]KAJ0851268.1 hypothetical protein HanPSC8_Chr13g0590231 [Helianthus annuus]